jgi:hypothetical protein
MEDEEHEVVPPGKPAIQWNAADAKSLIITVVGTVLGGMALVLVLGVAIVIARAYRDAHLNPVDWAGTALWPIVGLFAIREGYRRKVDGWIILGCGILVLLSLLVLVGVLYGVK